MKYNSVNIQTVGSNCLSSLDIHFSNIVCSGSADSGLLRSVSVCFGSVSGLLLRVCCGYIVPIDMLVDMLVIKVNSNVYWWSFFTLSTPHI